MSLRSPALYQRKQLRTIEEETITYVRFIDRGFTTAYRYTQCDPYSPQLWYVYYGAAKVERKLTVTAWCDGHCAPTGWQTTQWKRKNW